MHTHRVFRVGNAEYALCGDGGYSGNPNVTDGWARVTCPCCRQRRRDTVKESVKPFCWSVSLLFVSVLFAALGFSSWVNTDGLERLVQVVGLGGGAVISAAISVAALVEGCRSLRVWWRGVEPPNLGLCLNFECGNWTLPQAVFCAECEKKYQTPQEPPEPRWAHLLNRDDVMVLDTQTNGLDADAEVTDVAVVDTHGRVLLHDLRRRGASSYADVHGPLMRVLKRASIICVYNVDFEMKMIRQSAERHGLDATLDAETVCIMQEYADHYSADGRWSKLEDAARGEFVSVGGAPHRPLTDVRLTLGIMCAVVARERRKRGVASDDTRAPNYSGVSFIEDEDDIPF